MSRKKIFKNIIWLSVISIIVIVIASGGLFTCGGQESNFRVDSDKEIAKVILSQPQKETIILEKQKDGGWAMGQDQRVNEISIIDLTETLNKLTTRQPVSREMQDEVNQNLNLEGITVSVFVKKPLINIFNTIKAIPIRRLAKRFLIGQDAPKQEGAYMRTAGASIPYLVHIPGSKTQLTSFFSTEKVYWLDPVVVDLKADEINKIEVKNFFPERETIVIESKNSSHLLSVNQNIVSSDEISTLSLQRFLDSFEELYYEQLLLGQDSINELEKIVRPMFFQINIEDKSGNATSLDFYQKITEENANDPDRFFLVVNNQKLAIARYFVFNRIIKPSNYFIK